MTQHMIKTVSLKNGLELIFWDESKRIAGDRWQIAISAKIDFRVDDLISLNETPNPTTTQEMKTILGDTVCFEKKIIRNFVDEKEKDSIVMNICESYLSNAENYLSHKNFAERFVKKMFREVLENRRIDNLIKKGVDDGG